MKDVSKNLENFIHIAGTGVIIDDETQNEIKNYLVSQLKEACPFKANEIVNQIKEILKNGDITTYHVFSRYIIPDVVENLKNENIDNACKLALEFFDPYEESFQELLHKRMEQLFGGEEEINCGFYSIEMLKKQKNINGLKRVIKYYLKKGNYFGAKKAAGAKFLVDGNFDYLNRVTSLEGMKSIIEKLQFLNKGMTALSV